MNNRPQSDSAHIKAYPRAIAACLHDRDLKCIARLGLLAIATSYVAPPLAPIALRTALHAISQSFTAGTEPTVAQHKAIATPTAPQAIQRVKPGNHHTPG